MNSILKTVESYRREYTKKKSKSNQVILSSITRGVVTQSPEPEAGVSCVWAFRVELEFRSVVFEERGNPEYPVENLKMITTIYEPTELNH